MKTQLTLLRAADIAALILEQSADDIEEIPCDSSDYECLSIEDAELEETGNEPCLEFNGVPRMVDWFSDSEDSRYENN